MLYEVEVNRSYFSLLGFEFKVLAIGKHGQDCSLPMIIYTNLTPTSDRPAGETWVIEESIFMKRFYEVPPCQN